MIIAASVGLALAFMPKTENRAVLLKGIYGVQELLFTLIKAIIWALPVGILAFAGQLSAQIDAGVTVGTLATYVARWQRYQIFRHPAAFPAYSRFESTFRIQKNVSRYCRSTIHQKLRWNPASYPGFS